MVVVIAAAAAVAMFVVNEAFLEQVIGIVQPAVVVSLVVLVKLYRTDHIHAGPLLLVPCNSQETNRITS